ncbi:MAG: N-acetylmuramoyl-L-alanine amidase [Planctomycetota bacterium]
MLLVSTLVGCQSSPRVGSQVPRDGDEIMVAGQLFNTGTRVVLWTDPDGYDAYRTERRFADWNDSSWEATTRSGDGPSGPQRYNTRSAKSTSLRPLSKAELEQVRGGGWTLPMLRDRVDQFVLHYDVCGLSARCFDVLHDHRGLSVHFMLDIDGTIYQTMDVKERAWHATKANDRSVGIEIANMGAYPPPADPDAEPLLPEWYDVDGRGPFITIPSRLEQRYGPNGGVLDTNTWPLRPATSTPVVGNIQGGDLRQWDLTEPQYDALIKLTAALNAALPKIELDYPRDADGNVLSTTMPDEDWETFQGVIGHWHIQDNKIDPGPAFDWDRVVEGARDLR